MLVKGPRTRPGYRHSQRVRPGTRGIGQLPEYLLASTELLFSESLDTSLQQSWDREEAASHRQGERPSLPHGMLGFSRAG